MGRHCLSEPSDLNLELHPQFTGQNLSPWTSASTLCSQGGRYHKQCLPLYNNRRFRLPYEAIALQSLHGRFRSKEREKLGCVSYPQVTQSTVQIVLHAPAVESLILLQKGARNWAV
jgi:hypothetical protein